MSSDVGGLVHQNNGADVTKELCYARAQECRDFIPKTHHSRAKIMLEHIALTWERLAQRIDEKDD